jgi:hypothetical protein
MPLSRVAEAKAVGPQLDFVTENIVSLSRTGIAPLASEIPTEPVIRKTVARAFLRNNGEVITLWASANSNQWEGDSALAQQLKWALDSFQLL